MKWQNGDVASVDGLVMGNLQLVLPKDVQNAGPLVQSLLKYKPILIYIIRLRIILFLFFNNDIKSPYLY